MQCSARHHRACPGDAAIAGDDEIAIDLDSVRLAGFDPDDPTPMIAAAATAADVVEVDVAGRPVVRDGAHVSIDVPRALREAIAALRCCGTC